MNPIALSWPHVVVAVCLMVATVFCLKFSLIPISVGAGILAAMVGFFTPTKYVDNSKVVPPP